MAPKTRRMQPTLKPISNRSHLPALGSRANSGNSIVSPPHKITRLSKQRRNSSSRRDRSRERHENVNLTPLETKTPAPIIGSSGSEFSASKVSSSARKMPCLSPLPKSRKPVQPTNSTAKFLNTTSSPAQSSPLIKPIGHNAVQILIEKQREEEEKQGSTKTNKKTQDQIQSRLPKPKNRLGTMKCLDPITATACHRAKMK